jgi:hypothetical protein
VLRVPLPASHELGLGAGDERIGLASRGRPLRWCSGDPEPGPAVPELVRDAEGIVLRFDTLPAGEHRVRVPLVRTAEGTFDAGPALLRTDDPTRWGLAR